MKYARHTRDELNQKLKEGTHVLPPAGTEFEAGGRKCELKSYQVHFGRVNAEIEGVDMLQAVDVHSIERIIKIPDKIELEWSERKKDNKVYLLAQPVT